MPKWMKTVEFRWLALLVVSLLGVYGGGAKTLGEFAGWRTSVTEDLSEVKADVATLTKDMTQLKTDVRWIRDGKHLHDIARVEPKEE